MSALDVRQEGYLKRLKTQKRRYFVLRTLSACGKPRLEYFESEKKFRSNCSPKRVIQIASCFNIARKSDTKHDFVFALYTREDVFGLICESKEELQSWIDALLKEQTLNESLLGNEYLTDDVGDVQLPTMQKDYFTSHVSSWPVIVKPRGLGTSKKLAGTYDLKLADHTLRLQKTNSKQIAAEFHLTMVRRCGHTDCFFYMEVGRSSVTGAGELWLQVDDPILAQHLHEVVLMAMQSLSSDSGLSTLSRYRCHSGGHKTRPTSLLLPSSPRTRSETLPDELAESSTQDSVSSPIAKQKETENSSPSAVSKKSAMFQRLMSVGKRKSEILDFSPRLFSRRSQSKSLSIDPCPVGLHGRAQSVDFSHLFGASHQPNSPVTPEEREINFEIDEPFRTSSTSSGSSNRSWDRSLPRQYSHEERRDSGTSSKLLEVPDEGPETTSREDNMLNDKHTPRDSKDNGDHSQETVSRDVDRTLQRESNEKKDENTSDALEEIDDTSNLSLKSPLQRNHSGYEDMSGSLGCDTIEEELADENGVRSEISNETKFTANDGSLEREIRLSQNSPLQRRTSAHIRGDSPVLEHVQLQSPKSSPKQRRTSEPIGKISDEFRELVTFKNETLPSPRRSRKNASFTTNGMIEEDKSSPPTSPGRRECNESSEYVDMGSYRKQHTYVNLSPKEGSKSEEHSPYMNFRPSDINQETPIEIVEPAYMNIRRKDNQETSNDSEEPSYVNYRPRDVEEEPAYMNYRPGQIAVETTQEKSPSYVNFTPGNIQSTIRCSSPRQKSKHTYENLNPNGTIKIDEREFRDYMNLSPPKQSTNKSTFSRKSLPSRRPTSGKVNRTRRRESEPAVNAMGLKSDEENGMLFLDFSENKSSSSKGLNYIHLDLSKKDKSELSKPEINTPYSSSGTWDSSFKAAPLSTTSYAEIDFNKSHGLRQAIIDHKKTKTLKE